MTNDLRIQLERQGFTQTADIIEEMEAGEYGIMTAIGHNSWLSVMGDFKSLEDAQKVLDAIIADEVKQYPNATLDSIKAGYKIGKV